MEAASCFPTGTVTFLFTDIEGSTKIWEQYPEAMSAASARHDALLSAGIQQHGGTVVKSRGEGDSLFAVFSQATDAIAAACTLQQALLAEPWPTSAPLRVRIALHTAVAELRDGDYYGLGVNRCARLRAVAHGGQVLLSQAARDAVGEGLPPGAILRDLGSHRLKDLQQPEHLFQLLHASLPTDFPPLRSLEAFTHNLPAQLTSFIGREQAIAEVKQFLTNTRLLTLAGSGGCGKTRLALQVAAELVDQFPDGVWLMELAPLADPALVPQPVAAALGVREEPGRPLTETLIDYLKPKTLLLVLDNCEHLLAACASLADSLLRACPKLRILASSREGIGVAGEQTYRVPSLSVPDPQQLPSLERLQEYEAVQLFAARAALSQPAFAVTAANAPAVAQICRRLDGIPLAIELAAARVKALPVEQINERLSDMFRLLTGGSRTALPRQQTLRALIDWSYALLSEPERTLLRRLSAFAGGWTLEAAEAVCAGEGVEEWEVLDLLTSLVEKSLVLYDERGGEGRYRLLETVWQYARDRLLEAGEAEDVRGRHRDWFLALAEQGSEGESETARMDRLEREHDNLRAALAWSVAQEEAGEGLRLGGALWWFWRARGYMEEGREQLGQVLALPGAEARTAARAKALQGAGVILAIDQGDYVAAEALFEESVEIIREVDYQPGLGQLLFELGWMALNKGEHGAAGALLRERLAIAREAGDKRGLAQSLMGLGSLAQQQGEHEAARALWEENLAISRDLGDTFGIAWSLGHLGKITGSQEKHEAAQAQFVALVATNRGLRDKRSLAWSLTGMGWVARMRGDNPAARAALEESLVLFRELALKRGIAVSLLNLANVVHSQGKLGAARALFEESLVISREQGHKPRIAENLEGLAAVAVTQRRSARAAHLFGAAEGLREAMGAPPLPAERAEHDRSVAVIRTALGEEAFAAAWAEGRAMSSEAAIEYALGAGHPT